MTVLIRSACGEGSDEPACMHDLARAFTKICKLPKTSNNLETSSLSGHARMRVYKRLFRTCDKTKSHVCMSFSHDQDT